MLSKQCFKGHYWLQEIKCLQLQIVYRSLKCLQMTWRVAVTCGSQLPILLLMFTSKMGNQLNKILDISESKTHLSRM